MQYLNALHADHVVLECAHRPPEELQAFKDLRPEIGFGLGVVDIKATDVESADQVARAIERAEKVLGAGRVRYIHPDCGFWMLQALDRRRQDAGAGAGPRPVSKALPAEPPRNGAALMARAAVHRRLAALAAPVIWSS